MGLALGWMAIVLAGLAGAPKAERVSGPIQYTVRFVETEGLGWREAVFTRLTPVSRQGAATIWTAPENVIPKLLQIATKGSGPNSWTSPIMSARNGLPVHFAIRKNQQLVTQVAWNDDDRPETGKPETVRTGPVGTMTGRQLDQGVLIQLILEDTEVRAVHHLNLTHSNEHTLRATPATAVVESQVFIGHGKAAGLTAYAYSLPNPEASRCRESSEAPKDAISRAPGERRLQGTISQIRFEGGKTILCEKYRSKLLSRVGQPLDLQKIQADIGSLMHSKGFSDVQIFYEESPARSGKVLLTFAVHEMPVAKSATPAGDTCQKTSHMTDSTVSTDCARQEDEVIQAHLERISPASACCSSPTTAATCAKDDVARTVAIEVPEIATQEIAGEWLIPKDGILLVSFGPHTAAGQDGKAVIRERLAIIEAEGIADGAIQRTSRVPGFVPLPRPAVPAATAPPRPIPAPVVVPNLPTAVPVPPSRSIPQGAHPDGTPAELPPLPADETETPHPSDSAEPTASPQSKKSQQPAKPAADAQMKKTGYLTTPKLPAAPAGFFGAPNVGLQFLVPIRPISFQLPFNRRLEIEVFGRIVPGPEPISGGVSEE